MAGANVRAKRAQRQSRPKSTVQRELFPDLPDKIPIERSVSTLGFFSVQGGIPADGSLERTVEVDRKTPEGRIHARATIAVHKSSGGFPGVEEQDVYYAILSAVDEAMALGEDIPMPIRFAPGELLRRMNKEPGGPNYRALAQQLKRLAGTTIISDSAVYRADTDEWVSSSEEMFRIIDRVIARGERAPDGTVAQEHLIWLSSWQIENLRKRHRVIVDYQRYLMLRKDIAKALVPYLELWLFASRAEGRCERLYDKLCALLDIKAEQRPSDIRKQLQKPFEELVDAGYLSAWKLEQAGGVFAKRYKIVFFHGAAFEGADALEGADATGTAVEEAVSDEEVRHYVTTLEAEGVWRREALKLARSLTRAQVERLPSLVAFARARSNEGGVSNPGAFLADLLRADRTAPVAAAGSARPRRDVADAGREPTFEETSNLEALEELRKLREYEDETDRIINLLATETKVGLWDEAGRLLASEHPHSYTWAPQVRDRQHSTIYRRLVRERY